MLCSWIHSRRMCAELRSNNISNQKNHGRTPGLPLIENVPQVVKDAMVVVRELKGRYLWVDKYCIDQQDSKVKHDQIQNMDKVYGGACATIIACEGDSAEYGIP